MYNEILYPTDGSDGAGAALTNARDIATAYDATVHVLHVAEQLKPHGLSSDVEVTGSGGMVGDPRGGEAAMEGDRQKGDERQAEVEAHGREVVETAAERFGDVRTETAVRGGNPYEVILDYADEHDIDLVVMGTHGRTGLDRYLLGSVTEKVVRTSDVPVLTVRGGETAEL
jgi:nucleotide-binding universal stress UspA family protein